MLKTILSTLFINTNSSNNTVNPDGGEVTGVGNDIVGEKIKNP